MDAFGGGLAAHGEVCGAIIGGLAAISLLFGRSEAGKQEDFKMWKYSRVFMNRFKKEVADGKIMCREIAGVDWLDFDQVKQYRASDKYESCRQLVGKTAKIAGAILEEAQ